MEMKMLCPHCKGDFAAALPDQWIQAMGFDDRVAALGDGQTFEDLLFTSLSGDGCLPCPDCRERVPVREENLNLLAMELLAAC